MVGRMTPSRTNPIDHSRCSASPDLRAQDRERPRTVPPSAKLLRVFRHEGPFAFVRIKAAQAVSGLFERVRIGWQSRRLWRPDGRPVFLLVSHNCGGGTRRHVLEMKGALQNAGVRPLLVRPGRAGHLLWEEYGDLGRPIWCGESTDKKESVERHLDLLRPIHAHIHHVIGIPDVLIELLVVRGVPYDWTIHDYVTICPRVSLLDSDYRYCGEPDAASCDRCLARNGDDQGRAVTESITAWRERFSRTLGGARRVFAPSEDARHRLSRYFPQLKLLLRPHPEVLPKLASLAAPLRAGEDVRVAVIGTIVPGKGSVRLLACARDARDRGLPLAFHIIGSTDRDAVLTALGKCPDHRAIPRGPGLRASGGTAVSSRVSPLIVPRDVHVHTFDRDGRPHVRRLLRPGRAGRAGPSVRLGRGPAV